jgi:hypothetical protein
VAHVGRLTRLVGSGDGSMDPSPMIMNNMCVYIEREGPLRVKISRSVHSDGECALESAFDGGREVG